MTPKQAIFYGEYIKDSNATRAAIAAGFPERSAHVAGARLLKNKKVAAAIKAWRERQVEKLEVTAETVVQELAKLAFYDPGKLYDKDGKLIPVAQLDDVTRAAVSQVEDETTSFGAEVTRRQKVKLADKGQNLERLGRYLKLFTDNVDHHHKFTLEDLVCGGQGEPAGDAAHR